MANEVTDDLIKAGRLVFRDHGATAMVVLVGPLNFHQIGTFIDGLPVVASPVPLGEGDYQLHGVWVTQAGIACMDLGME